MLPASVLPAPVLRLLMCLLALCVGLQGMALTAMRAQGRSHYHATTSQIAGAVSTAEIRPLQALTVLLKNLVPDPGQAIFVHRREALRATAGTQFQTSVLDHPHAHAVRASHGHDAHDRTAVWVGEDDGKTVQNQTDAPSRALHDLDGLSTQSPAPADTSRSKAWAVAPNALVTSLLTPPPKRPPRA